MRNTIAGSFLVATPPMASDDGTRFMGIFLMVLWSLAMVVFTGDMVMSGGPCAENASCAWTGLGGIHLGMQVVLLAAALGTGATGAALWFGTQRPSSPTHQ